MRFEKKDVFRGKQFGIYFVGPSWSQGGTSKYGGRGGGLGPHIKFGGQIWGKVRPSSQNKRKNLGSSVTKRPKSWEKVPILGSYLKFRGQNLGYLSFILLEAKFRDPTRISDAKFGAKPPRPPDMEVPPLGAGYTLVTTC